MKILILGADGYLGWPTVMYFSKKGYEVYAVDNLSKEKLRPSMALSLLIY